MVSSSDADEYSKGRAKWTNAGVEALAGGLCRTAPGKRLPPPAKFRRGPEIAEFAPFSRTRRTRMMAYPMLEPASAALVLAGTLIATQLRCGWSDTRAALGALARLVSRPFDAAHVRAELAIQVQEIEEDGLVRAEPHHSGDDEFDELTDTLLRARSMEALHERHKAHRAERMDAARRGAAVLSSAAELAPVLGLAGTLISLGRLSTAVESADFGAAIGAAVATTLYGLVAANFVFAPLAAIVVRRAEAEDAAREEIINWLSAAVELSCRHHLEPARQVA
jgi:chemotaxis protein MotA